MYICKQLWEYNVLKADRDGVILSDKEGGMQAKGPMSCEDIERGLRALWFSSFDSFTVFSFLFVVHKWEGKTLSKLHGFRVAVLMVQKFAEVEKVWDRVNLDCSLTQLVWRFVSSLQLDHALKQKWERHRLFSNLIS